MKDLLLAVAVYAALLGLIVASVKVPFLARHMVDVNWALGLVNGWLLCDWWRDRNKTGPRSAVGRVMAGQAKALKGSAKPWRMRWRRR